MPHLADGPLVGAEGGQTGGDVRNVAVGVGQVGVAEEVGALAGDGVGEDPLAERRLGDAGTEEVRGPPDGDAHPTGVGGGQQLSRHRRPGPPFDRRCGEREVLRHRLAGGRAVAVHVLEAHQQRIGALGRGQHTPLQRREALRPLRVRGVEALIDDRRAFGRVSGGVRVGGVGGPPVDPVGQRWWPTKRHRPHLLARTGQMSNERVPDLAGTEHDMQLAVVHEVSQPCRWMRRWRSTSDRGLGNIWAVVDASGSTAHQSMVRLRARSSRRSPRTKEASSPCGATYRYRSSCPNQASPDCETCATEVRSNAPGGC